MMQADIFHQAASRRTYAHLYTLNLGLGRDSMTLLSLLCEGKGLRDGDRMVYARDIDAVIFSDTGAEWAHTYALLPRVQRMCKKAGLRFLNLRKPQDRVWQAPKNNRAKGSRVAPAWCRLITGETIEQKAARGRYHRRLPILDEYMRFSKLAVTVSASCTDNHKVLPIRRAMNDLSLEIFGVSNRSWSADVRGGRRPRHRVIIGIAADEESRAINTGRPAYEWAIYPLLEMGITKAGESEILERNGLGGVYKSGCFMCPYQPIGWYWVLRELDPLRWRMVVGYEAAALALNPKMHIIGGGRGRPIAESVDRWRARHPDATHDTVLSKSYNRCQKAMGRDARTAAGSVEVAA